MILDNAEHQLPTCVALSQALLAEASGVKIILTSRHLTGITAEQPLPVNRSRSRPPGSLRRT